ncbi:MAG TPA: DUF72 domain-containing protein [Actinomycetota bacterium]
MEVLIGTSGWQYDDWRGVLYPERVAKKDWLAHYSERFPVVEVNNTFYNLPADDTFVKWRRGTAEGFRFVVKASRFITHIRRLRECRDPVQLLWSRAERLGRKLGPVLFQMPPNLRADHERLRAFLEVLPKHMEAAFEFRHRSWESDDTYDLLDRGGYAYVLADRPGARVPDVVTGGWSYLRFHQGTEDGPGYTRRKLRRWADRIAGLDARTVYVFFNNDQTCAAVRDARTLTHLLEDRHDLRVKGPVPEAA